MQGNSRHTVEKAVPRLKNLAPGAAGTWQTTRRAPYRRRGLGSTAAPRFRPLAFLLIRESHSAMRMELYPKVDGAVKSRWPTGVPAVVFPVPRRINRSVFALALHEHPIFLRRPPLVFRLSWSDGSAAADIEAKGAQVDDVAHGGHAANAQMGQVHLVF